MLQYLDAIFPPSEQAKKRVCANVDVFFLVPGRLPPNKRGNSIMQQVTTAADRGARTYMPAVAGCLDTHPGLPEGITKMAAIETIAKALRLQRVSAIAVNVFRLIANTTLERAWRDAAAGAPMNWRRQSDMAEEVGITTTHFRRCEQQLAQLGVIARLTADNGWRGRVQTSEGIVEYGLSLAPAIANYGHFTGIVAERTAYDEERAVRAFWCVAPASGSVRSSRSWRDQNVSSRSGGSTR
jgi:hypothetical protein